MWLPIALGQFAVSLTSAVVPPPLTLFTWTLGYTAQALLGAWALRRFGFVGSIANTRDAFVLLAVVLVVPTLAPAFTTLVSYLVGNLSVGIWTNFSRLWAGGVMSALIIVPFITPWALSLSSRISKKEAAETTLGLLAVCGATYLVFWTSFPRVNVFVAIFVLLAVLFWVGMRLRPRFMTLSLFLVALLGITGSIVAMPGSALNQQLFASELFIILITPIFLILTAVVTERMRAISQFKERTDELEQALRKLSAEDKAKTEFIATLAHELRNPLSPVMSTLELLKFSAIPPDVVRLVEGAQAQTQNMKRLLDDLLDVARITKKSFHLKKELVEFSPLLSRAIAGAQGYLHSRSHTLSVTLPPQELLLEVDPVRFEQIVVNLLNNAAKYTNSGGHISLVCRKDESAVSISISDTGIGIEPERLERVFEPFGGVEAGRRPGGLHLGLSLAKRMAELHGGTLSAASAGPGRGSTFTLRLPLSQALAPRVMEPQEEKVPSARYRILVVDDNEPAAQGLGKLLSMHGHEVAVTFDGKGALALSQSFEPQVVLLDIGLPDMDGYTIAKELLARPHCPMLVALTGYGQEEDKDRARQAGFSHHLTKPVGIAELQHVIVGLKPAH